jgi:hypothetical protein
MANKVSKYFVIVPFVENSSSGGRFNDYFISIQLYISYWKNILSATIID